MTKINKILLVVLIPVMIAGMGFAANGSTKN
jgi:hypothetical protein